MRKLFSIVLILSVLAGCAPAETPVDPAVSPSPTQTIPEPTAAPEPTPPPEPITATLTVAGDIMCHNPQLRAAYVAETGTYDFTPALRYAQPWIEAADLAVGNLETTFAGGANYSGYPYFNTPDELATALKGIGFDLLSTTNNHSLDRGFSGLTRTLDVLDSAGLAHVGTYRTQEERDRNHGITVADCGGISIAFLSYSYGTNAIPVAEGNDFSINLFNTDYLTNLSTPDTALLESDMAAARQLGCDLIAVMMHWGIEYQVSPNSYQKRLAETLVDLGADLILGGHPHVLQPYNFITTEAGNSGFVCYSLGNFISNQDFDDTNSTALLNLELKKDLITGETTVENVSYVPCFMVNPGANFLNKPVILLDTYAAMAEYESGNQSVVTDSIYAQLQHNLEFCHRILGSEGDSQAEPEEIPPQN